jgi:hypothetical protein
VWCGGGGGWKYFVLVIFYFFIRVVCVQCHFVLAEFQFVLLAPLPSITNVLFYIV